jgi:hypothetical protein
VKKLLPSFLNDEREEEIWKLVNPALFIADIEQNKPCQIALP